MTHDISQLTCADCLRSPGVQTPVIVRFSTVIHERGSPETLRDPRGFAVSSCPCYYRSTSPALVKLLWFLHAKMFVALQGLTVSLMNR